MHGVACSLLAALSAIAALGVRYPVQMLPLLLFELLWKSIWLLAIALPFPWPYVYANYVRKPGDRWK